MVETATCSLTLSEGKKNNEQICPVGLMCTKTKVAGLRGVSVSRLGAVTKP